MIMGLFLGSLVCSIDLCVYFCASSLLFSLLQLCSVSWNLRLWYLQFFFFFFPRLIWLFGVLYGSIQMLGLFIPVLEKCCWYFDIDCIKSVNCFAWFQHFSNICSSSYEQGISFRLFVFHQFLSSMFYSFQCIDLLPLWLNLFLGTLLFWYNCKWNGFLNFSSSSFL